MKNLIIETLIRLTQIGLFSFIFTTILLTVLHANCDGCEKEAELIDSFCVSFLVFVWIFVSAIYLLFKLNDFIVQ